MEDVLDQIDSPSIKSWKVRKAPKSHWNKIAQFKMTSLGLAPLVDRKTGRPKTGLTKEVQHQLEKDLQMEENELGPRSDFWIDFQIKLTDEIYRLDLSEPEDQLAFHFLRAHKLVAQGHEDLKKNPNAQYVLYNDVDEAQSQVRAGNVKKDAYKAFIGMSNQEMVDVLMVLGKPIVSQEPAIIEAMMGRVVETEPKALLDIVGDADFKMKLFVLKCVHYDLLVRSRGKDLNSALFYYGEEMLGEGINRVVKVLNSKANQKVFLALEKRLEMAMSAGTLAGAPILTGHEVEELIVNEANKGPKKKVTNKKITSNAAKGRGKNTNIADSSRVDEVQGEGLNSGDFDEEAPEVL